jgi:hypothetical protein
VEHRFNVESASVDFSSITTQGSHEFLDHTAVPLLSKDRAGLEDFAR